MVEILRLFLVLSVVLLPYLLIGLCPVVIIGAVSNQIDGSRSKSWPVAKGVIISLEVRKETDEDGFVSYRPDVRYEYEVNNKCYQVMSKPTTSRIFYTRR